MNVIEVDQLSKKFKLGVYGGKTMRDDFSAWLAKIRGKENPLINISEKSRVNSNEEFWALREINFSVQQGEVLGIIGRNGAGKSTLLKLLSRISYPTMGEIRIKGRIASLLEVGTGFHPELTGKENVYLNGAILGMNRNEIQAKFDEIVAFSGIEHHIDTPVKRYSSGMKVRLGFAVAAHLEPEILVIDEVLAVGDAEFQKKCLGKMQDVSKQGRTVLFVSHNMSAVRSLCTRSILLNDGKLIFEGNVDTAINSYLKTGAEEQDQNLGFRNFPKDEITPICFSFIKLKKKEEISNSFEHEDEIKVEFGITRNSSINSTYLFFMVSDNLGNWIFATSNEETGENGLLKDIKGDQLISVIIPSNLLKPGIYFITIALRAYDQQQHFVKYENTISFEIVDTTTFRGQKNLYRKPAIIAPKLVWIQ
jgi:lipopolysaccharide transport system ATP-binding protein